MHRVETALSLVQVVGDITGDIRRIAVALDHDAVLVVTKSAGAQPGCAVLLVDVAGLAQPGDGLVDTAAGVHRVFVGVDVEVGAELVQRLFDVGEHQVDTDFAEGLAYLGLGQAQRVGRLLQNLRGDVGDVGARVAVVGDGFALGRGDQRADEPVDLGAVVVEIVFAQYVGALRRQQPAQRVADGGPAGTPDVDGSGRVGRDEFQVDLVPGQCVGVAEVVAGVDDVVDDHGLRRRLEAHVDEAGPGHLRRGDAVGLRQRLGQPSGQFTRVRADLFAELQRQVARVIAVLGVARPLHGDRRRQRGSVQPALGQHRGSGGFEQLSQVGGGHERPSYGLGCSRPESIAVVEQSPRYASLSVLVRSPMAQHLCRCAPVAQGIERLPPEQKAAGSNPAGGTSVYAA